MDPNTVGNARIMLSVTATTVAGVMPVFLVGASGMFIRTEFGFREADLGLMIGVSMAVSAAFAIPFGRLAERMGARLSLILVGVGSAIVMLGIAMVAENLTHFVALLAIGGLFNSLSNPATALAIARGQLARPGLKFGIKQSATPAATLLAGGSVPLISMNFGWRWAFALGACIALCAAFSTPRQLQGKRLAAKQHVRVGSSSTPLLVLLAAAVGVGTAAAVSLGAFLVESLVAGGLDPAAAGWMVVVASAAGILARLIGGVVADRHADGALTLVAGMLLLGSAGYLVLAFGESTLLIGAVLGFSCGWGWQGLVFFAVVRLEPNAPAAATGIVVAGGNSGSAVGPVVFGLVVTAGSFQLAWQLAAAAALVAALLVAASQAWVRTTAIRHGPDGNPGPSRVS